MNHDVTLRMVRAEDLPVFFRHQNDDDAVRQAAFTVPDPTDRSAFDRRWERLLADAGVTVRTILFDGDVAGHVASFTMEGDREITYWTGREFWGRGLATRALARFLEIEATRPLHARAAADNAASQRVLEKCGFRLTGSERNYAAARETEIEECLYRLD